MALTKRRWSCAGGVHAVLAVLCLGCAGAPVAGQVEKGGLVPVAVHRDKLAAALQPRRVALLVGVQRFDDPLWRPLRFPEADAVAFGDVLRDAEKGAFDEVEVLGGALTRDGFRSALKRLAERTRDEQDTVVVYLSSHGTLARDATGSLRRYLVMTDTSMADVPGTAFSMDELKQDFDRLRSRRKVLVLATCHSGGGKSLLPDGVQQELAGIKAGFFVRPIEEVSRASVVLAASDWGETAREDEQLGHDVYTNFFIEALRIGADRNGDGAVTASEAHDYARRMTYQFTGGRQRPSAESTEVGVDPIVLVGKVLRVGKPELYSYAASLDGFEILVDGKPLAELPGGVAVDPGRYRVQVTKGGGPALFDGRVALDPGQRVDLQDLVNQAEGRWEVGPRVGVFSFIDQASRQQLLGASGTVGVTASLRDWPGRHLTLRVDVAGASGRGSYMPSGVNASYDYQLFNAGVAVAWRAEPPWLPGGSLLAGPRLSALRVARQFALELASAPQTYFTMTPGLLLGADFPVWKGLVASTELHVDWAVVKVDGQDRSTGFGEWVFGVGYRFR
jgi:Caspase domain